MHNRDKAICDLSYMRFESVNGSFPYGIRMFVGIGEDIIARRQMCFGYLNSMDVVGDSQVVVMVNAITASRCSELMGYTMPIDFDDPQYKLPNASLASMSYVIICIPNFSVIVDQINEEIDAYVSLKANKNKARMPVDAIQDPFIQGLLQIGIMYARAYDIEHDAFRQLSSMLDCYPSNDADGNKYVIDSSKPYMMNEYIQRYFPERDVRGLKLKSEAAIAKQTTKKREAKLKRNVSIVMAAISDTVVDYLGVRGSTIGLTFKEREEFIVGLAFKNKMLTKDKIAFALNSNSYRSKAIEDQDQPAAFDYIWNNRKHYIEVYNAHMAKIKSLFGE